MKYPKLEGICGQAIKNNLCLGCQKLEDVNFKGVEKCPYMPSPHEYVKEIIGIQEKIEI